MRWFGRELSAAKHYFDGTHRAVDPVATVARFSPVMKRIGITRLANVTGLDSIGHPVFVAIRPNSRSLATAQGKGHDVDCARASALMESIEQWHAEHIDQPLRFDSYNGMRSRTLAVSPADLPRRSGVGVPPEDRPMLWIEGWDLCRQQASWVPFDCVSLNMVRGGADAPLLLQSSNGLASGNHLLEAVCHGLCEVIERDAITLWQILGDDEEAKKKQLDLESVDSPFVRATVEQVVAAKVRVAAWDITSDIGIPTYSCGLYDEPRWRGMSMVVGYGAHLDPGVALMRALSEAIQTRATIISGSRDDLLPDEYKIFTGEELLRELDHELRDPPPTLSFAARASAATGSFEDDLELLLTALRSRGLDRVIAVDLSREELGVPVVRVVVPGLEPGPVAGVTLGRRAMAMLAERP